MKIIASMFALSTETWRRRGEQTTYVGLLAPSSPHDRLFTCPADRSADVLRTTRRLQLQMERRLSCDRVHLQLGPMLNSIAESNPAYQESEALGSGTLTFEL